MKHTHLFFFYNSNQLGRVYNFTWKQTHQKQYKFHRIPNSYISLNNLASIYFTLHSETNPWKASYTQKQYKFYIITNSCLFLDNSTGINFTHTLNQAHSKAIQIPLNTQFMFFLNNKKKNSFKNADIPATCEDTEADHGLF